MVYLIGGSSFQFQIKIWYSITPLGVVFSDHIDLLPVYSMFMHAYSCLSTKFST